MGFLSVCELSNYVAERVVPAARIHERARLVRELGFDLLLVSDRFLFVAEGVVVESLFGGSVRRHNPPTEVVAVTDGATSQWLARNCRNCSGETHRNYL